MGDGTQASPYTTQEVIALNTDNGTDDVWVTGFIIGTRSGGSVNALSGSIYNIVLSSGPDLATTFDMTKHITVDFDSLEAIIMATPSAFVGHQVKIKGKLDLYYSNPGLKTCTEYEFIVDDNFVAAPLFSHSSCSFSQAFDLTITTSTAGADIFYTTDGSTPDALSTPYPAAGINIPAATVTIKAIAIEGDNVSEISEETYTYIAIDPNAKIETFSSAPLTSSYQDSTFVGDNNIRWSYVSCRDHNGDANNSGINGKAIMLKEQAKSSKVYSEPISGGIGSLMVKLYKGFTSKGGRQAEVLINGVVVDSSEVFDDNAEHILHIDNINVAGDFTIEIRNIKSKQIIVDDITWMPFIPTSTQLGAEDSSVIYALDGTLYVETQEGYAIDIYSINGTYLYGGLAEDNITAISSLPQGTVIVVVNGKAHKTIVR